MRRFSFHGVQFEVYDKVFIEVLTAINEVEEALKVMKANDFSSRAYSDAYHNAYHSIEDVLEKTDYQKAYKPYYNLVLDSYRLLNAQEHRDFYNASIEDFVEYKSHKNEDDFDWDYYSDWHKDLFGFRPRH